MSSQSTHSYCVVLNIPNNYRSKHLRNYFNELIERKAFNCFHFRHRPQNLKTFTTNSDNNQNICLNQTKRFCAIIDVKTDRLNELIEKFNNKFWVNFENGNDFGFKCCIKLIKIIYNNKDCNERVSDKGMDLLRKNTEINASIARKHRNKDLINRLKAKTNEKEIDLNERSDELMLTLAEVKSLRELNPPIDIMPNGNVGTPSEVFLQLISECRLPAPVISKLELEFPKSMQRKIYSKVDYKYEDKRRLHKISDKYCDKNREKNSNNNNLINNKDLDLVKTRNGFVINETFSQLSNKRDIEHKNDDNCAERKDNSDSDEDGVEEWDRYEALHEDVTQQERNRERLFEEEIELKWEKGGSGLVFYTDAQFWDIKDNCEDYNEKTPDDWDLDLSLYRRNCSADKEAIDLKALTDEMKLRKGKRKYDKFCVDSVCEKSKSNSRIGSFEKHTKGFGRKIMESQGWKCGQGLGQSIAGIPEPIEDSGQLPSDKRGFGYRGERLKSFQFL